MKPLFTRILGAALLVGALAALWFVLPSYFPMPSSASGFILAKRPVLMRLALSYLVVGITVGFGLALLTWPWVLRESAQSPPKG